MAKTTVEKVKATCPEVNQLPEDPAERDAIIEQHIDDAFLLVQGEIPEPYEEIANRYLACHKILEYTQSGDLGNITRKRIDAVEYEFSDVKRILDDGTIVTKYYAQYLEVMEKFGKSNAFANLNDDLGGDRGGLQS